MKKIIDFQSTSSEINPSDLLPEIEDLGDEQNGNLTELLVEFEKGLVEVLDILGPLTQTFISTQKK